MMMLHHIPLMIGNVMAEYTIRIKKIKRNVGQGVINSLELKLLESKKE